MKIAQIFDVDDITRLKQTSVTLQLIIGYGIKPHHVKADALIAPLNNEIKNLTVDTRIVTEIFGRAPKPIVSDVKEKEIRLLQKLTVRSKLRHCDLAAVRNIAAVDHKSLARKRIGREAVESLSTIDYMCGSINMCARMAE